MDITEQIIDESLINSWNVFLGKREGGGGNFRALSGCYL